MSGFGNFSGGQGGIKRQIFDVSSLGLKCDTCSKELKELPFKPTQKEDGTYGKLYCQDCNRSRQKFDRR